MDNILKIIKDTSLTYEQKVLTLAKAAENSIKPLNIDDETQNTGKKGSYAIFSKAMLHIGQDI